MGKDDSSQTSIGNEFRRAGIATLKSQPLVKARHVGPPKVPYQKTSGTEAEHKESGSPSGILGPNCMGIQGISLLDLHHHFR